MKLPEEHVRYLDGSYVHRPTKALVEAAEYLSMPKRERPWLLVWGSATHGSGKSFAMAYTMRALELEQGRQGHSAALAWVSMREMNMLGRKPRAEIWQHALAASVCGIDDLGLEREDDLLEELRNALALRHEKRRPTFGTTNEAEREGERAGRPTPRLLGRLGAAIVNRMIDDGARDGLALTWAPSDGPSLRGEKPQRRAQLKPHVVEPPLDPETAQREYERMAVKSRAKKVNDDEEDIVLGLALLRLARSRGLDALVLEARARIAEGSRLRRVR